MKIWGVTEKDIKFCVELVSKVNYKNNLIIDRTGFKKVGKAIQFKLRVKSSKEPGHTINHSGRNWISACWHCHRDIYKAIFKINPDTRIKTALADYHGLVDFNWKYENTAYINVGSQNNPMDIKSACEC